MRGGAGRTAGAATRAATGDVHCGGRLVSGAGDPIVARAGAAEREAADRYSLSFAGFFVRTGTSPGDWQVIPGHQATDHHTVIIQCDRGAAVIGPALSGNAADRHFFRCDRDITVCLCDLQSVGHVRTGGIPDHKGIHCGRNAACRAAAVQRYVCSCRTRCR